MRIGELFSGYGGLGLGVQAAMGGEVVWHSDIDAGPRKILAHRYPDVPNLGDITCVYWSQVEPVDVLTGGFPCQDVSAAGRRAGIRPGSRSGLWAHMAHAIDQLRPALVVAENVRGLLSAPAHSDLEPCPWCLGDERADVLRALGAVLGDLAVLGYDAQWVGLRAADVGAPHGRFRIFITATDAAQQPGDGRGHYGADQAHPQGHGLHTQTGRSDRASALFPSPRTSDTNGAGHHGDGGLDLRTAVTLLPTPAVADADGTRAARGGDRSDELLLNGIAREHAAGRLLPTPKVGSTSPAAHGQISGQYREQMAEALQSWGNYADAIAGWETVLGRSAPAPTQPSRKGTPQLSATFVEWLMGLPDGWVTDVPGITRNEALRALGNGVVPQQAAAALRYLLSVREVPA